MGSGLLVCILMLHGFGMYQVMHRFERYWTASIKEKSELRRQLFFGGLISMMLFTHLSEVVAWAEILTLFKAMPDFHTAFYFAGETYTTVGFGDVILPLQWRQMALFISISGLFSFGWTTGILVGMVHKIYETDFAHLRGHKK